MEDDKVTAVTTLRRRPAIAELLEQYGCGPVQFTGTDNALYERHLIFDNVVEPLLRCAARTLRGLRPLGSRHPFAALGAYREDLQADNAKRIYYLSMEFLIGRSLTNNVTNLLLDPLANACVTRKESRLARPCRAGA